jgi:hypothetical protein
MGRDVAEPIAFDTCDICGRPRTRSERQRLVWDSGFGIELILAELCRECAARPDGILEMYGGPRNSALRVTEAAPASKRDAASVRAIRGMVLRGLLYVLVALAAFVVVTAVTSRG